MFRIGWLLVGLMTVGCGEKPTETDTAVPDDSSDSDDSDAADTDDTDDTDDSASSSGCAEVTMKIRYQDEDYSPDEVPNPHLAEEWFVRLYCDGAVMVSANHLWFDPPTMATVEDYNTIATFIETGDGVMTMQAGGQWMTHDLTVLE